MLLEEGLPRNGMKRLPTEGSKSPGREGYHFPKGVACW